MTEVINARVDAVPDGFTYFDTGFYVISHTLATRIANGKLPEHGRERLVIWADRYWQRQGSVDSLADVGRLGYIPPAWEQIRLTLSCM